MVYENHPADSRVKEMGDTCTTVTSRWGTGGGNVPLVQQAFRKGRRAQSKDDYETWVDDGKANTLNTFDLGDVRTTHAIALAENTIGRQPHNGGNGNGFTEDGPMYTLNATGVHGIAHAVSFSPSHFTRGFGMTPTDELSGTIKAEMNDNSPHVAVGVDVYNHAIDGNIAATMTEACGGSNTSGPKVMANMAVRRLTPIECERLQGFSDNYTNIKPNCPDGPRYKALGNSWAVPVVAWIGKRINDAIA
jgi:DNA (cytosine-5)-methyltransferase 1